MTDVHFDVDHQGFETYAAVHETTEEIRRVMDGLGCCIKDSHAVVDAVQAFFDERFALATVWTTLQGAYLRTTPGCTRQKTLVIGVKFPDETGYFLCATLVVQ